VARGVEEHDATIAAGDIARADVLGDAATLAGVTIGARSTRSAVSSSVKSDSLVAACGASTPSSPIAVTPAVVGSATS